MFTIRKITRVLGPVIPSLLETSFTHFRTASSVPVFAAGDHYQPDCLLWTAQGGGDSATGPYSARTHNREPSPSSCCKADLSIPWISPRETGDTWPLLSDTSHSVKHRDRCHPWSWSSSNFKQKNKFPSEPLELTLVFPATLQSSLCYPGMAGLIFIKPFLKDRLFCFSWLFGQRAPAPWLCWDQQGTGSARRVGDQPQGARSPLHSSARGVWGSRGPEPR